MNKEGAIWNVYSLCSSEDERIRYVGQTTPPIRKRLAQHLSDARNRCSDYPVQRWILKAERNGHKISIELLEDRCERDLSEIEWIAFFRSVYNDLTNVSNGGDHGLIGRKHTDETLQKMRKPKSEYTRQRMRKPKSIEARRNMSLGQLGNTKSQGESNRHARLTVEKVIDIKRKLMEGIGGSQLAREYGLKKSAISKIRVGRNWSHVTV